MPMKQKLTVTELTKIIKDLIETRFSKSIKIVGEISSLSRSSSGHFYFILKDEKARLKAVMFKGSAQNNPGYEPKNGDQVEVSGMLNLYENEGVYQIIVKRINYDSIGEFYKKFEETKRKMEAEGFFSPELKKKLPKFPARIAVLTSLTGAAIKDFIATSKINNARYEVDIWPVQVQGTAAIPGIVASINAAGKMRGRYDVLVLMRGGGSLEDLFIFNDEMIARALALSDVPAISAIGHERDYTICDLVADRRATTPTDAASILSEIYKSYKKNLVEYVSKQTKIFEHKFIVSSQILDSLLYRLKLNSPGIKIRYLKEKITHSNIMLNSIIGSCTTKKKMSLNSHIYKIKELSPAGKVDSYKNNIEFLRVNLFKNFRHILVNHYNILDVLSNKLYSFNPDNIIKKGYAIITSDRVILKSIKDINLEDELAIRMQDGYVYSFVTGKKGSKLKNEMEEQ